MYLYQNARYVVINIVLFNIHTSCTIFNWCINSVLQVCCLWQSPWNCWWLRGAKCQQWNDWHMQLKMRVRKCLLLDFGWFHANSIILMITMHFASRNPTDKVKCDLLRMRTVSLGGRVDIVKKEREPSLLPIGMCYCPVTRAQADEGFFHHRLWCDAVMMIGFLHRQSESTYSESLLSRSGRSFLTSRDPDRDRLLNKDGFWRCTNIKRRICQ